MKFRRNDEDHPGLIKRLDRRIEEQEREIANVRAELRELRQEYAKVLARNELLETAGKDLIERTNAITDYYNDRHRYPVKIQKS